MAGFPQAFATDAGGESASSRKKGARFEVHQAGPSAKMLMSLALSWKKDWVRELGLASRVGTDALDKTICSLMNTTGLGSALGVLRFGAEPVAVASGFLYRDRFYCFVRAYRPDRAAQSVGWIVVTELIEWCAAQGVTVYDYGPPADPFKLEWTDHVRPVANRLVPLSFLGRLHGRFFEGKVKPAARAVVASLRRRSARDCCGLPAIRIESRNASQEGNETFERAPKLLGRRGVSQFDWPCSIRV